MTRQAPDPARIPSRPAGLDDTGRALQERSAPPGAGPGDHPSPSPATEVWQYAVPDPSRCWRHRNGAPITVRARSQGIRDHDKRFGLEHCTPHDLRRTAASFMTIAGARRLHVEKVLNDTGKSTLITRPKRAGRARPVTGQSGRNLPATEIQSGGVSLASKMECRKLSAH